MTTRAVSLEAFGRDVQSGRFQQFLALATAFFALIAGGEAFFEHLRGSFCQRVMWTPVWLSPIIVVAGIGAALDRRIARTVLPITAAASIADGLLGFYHHLKTVREMPGGVLGNFWYNFTAGPPLFAPLLFCAVGLMGLIAAAARREGTR
ncbi:MAG TPA: hypothetical protein VFZ25_13975 [Chloroflexota bacterium]|nr:hypothetical protein [Chloroflexota bacterium]